MEQRKIILVNDYYPKVKGGAEYQAFNLGLLFKEQGFQVIFISLGFDKNEVFVDDNLFKIYTFKTPKSKLHTFSLYLFFSKQITNVIQLEKPNLVYQRVLNSFSSYIARMCYNLKTPYCLHIADNYCLEFDETLRGRIKKVLFNRLIKYPVHFICQTDIQQKNLKRYGKQATVLPNILPIESVLCNKSNTEFKVLWVANIRPVKQLREFLNIAKECENQAEIEFIVIGRKDNISVEENSSLNILKNVRYFGELDQKEVLTQMEESHVLMNTSISEGFSNTFIQAWSRGMLVLSLNSDPNGLIEKYKVGFIANGSIRKLKESLILLSTNSILYKEYSKNVQTLFENQFDYKRNKQVILNYFKQIDE